MRVGISGHQDRDGIDWTWVRDEIAVALTALHAEVVGLSSLAAGADQVFARCVLRGRGRLIAVVPEANYEDAFDGADDLEEYRALLVRSEVVRLAADGTEEESFLKAGRWIVNHSDEMIAVWDGEPAEGLGGTADIVAYACQTGTPVLHLNPIIRSVRRIGG